MQRNTFLARWMPDEDNGHGLPLQSESMRSANPSWHLVPGAGFGRDRSEIRRFRTSNGAYPTQGRTSRHGRVGTVTVPFAAPSEAAAGVTGLFIGPVGTLTSCPSSSSIPTLRDQFTPDCQLAVQERRSHDVRDLRTCSRRLLCERTSRSASSVAQSLSAPRPRVRGRSTAAGQECRLRERARQGRSKPSTRQRRPRGGAFRMPAGMARLSLHVFRSARLPRPRAKVGPQPRRRSRRYRPRPLHPRRHGSRPSEARGAG